jgi:putative FmdB family regulatory protein
MPVYTYRCESCGIQFERSQKFSDASLTRCPECGKKTLRKVYTPVGIVFKGSGFYSTDHKSSSGAPRLSGGPSESKSEDRSENRSDEPGKTENKPSSSTTEKPSTPKTEEKD